jgi:hypothetical protein
MFPPSSLSTQEWLRELFCGAHGLITGGAAYRLTVDAPASFTRPVYLYQTKTATTDLDRSVPIERRVAMFSVAKQAQSPAATADRDRSCTPTPTISDVLFVSIPAGLER